MSKPKLHHLLVVAVASISLTGCSASVSTEKTVNTDNAEKLIQSQIKSNTGVKSTATCPDDVKAKAGAKFECKIVSEDGEKATAVVTQKDDEGNVNVVVK